MRAAWILLVSALAGVAHGAEPTIGQVQAAAASVGQASPARALDAADRARSSALLPVLRLRVARDMDRDESVDLEPGRADQLGLDASERTVLEVRAEWDLARLAFDPDELSALETAVRLARERREVVSAATRLYYERRRLLRLVARGPARPEDRARLAETTALLDAMTGGLYRRPRRP